MKSVADRLAHLSPAKRALLQRLQAQEAKDDSLEAIPRHGGRKTALPLSFSQQRLWFLDQLEGANATYNMPVAVRLEGRLDVDTLERVFKEILRRHESIRTNFHSDNGKPVQTVSEHSDWELGRIDISDTPLSDREARIARLAAAEAQLPFDLAKDALLRSTVIKSSDDMHIVLITMHHIASDGWSIGNVLLHELITLYTDFTQNKESSLDELPIQYTDFAIWQQEWLKGERLSSQLSYWTKQLEGIPALLELPTDLPRPSVQAFEGQVYNFTLDQSLLTKLKTLSQKSGVTLFMTLLSGFSALLWRYSGQDDVVVGSPIAGRNKKELEPLIGFFINSLVFRTTFTQGMTGTDLLTKTRQTCLDAFQHQDVPFERLVEAIKPERSPSFSPLFQVMFILQTQNAERSDLTAGDVKLTTLPIDAGTSMFDFTLKLEEQSGRLEGEFEFNTALFKLETIKRIVNHYTSLLENLTDNPDQVLSQIPLMLKDERQQIIDNVNKTYKDFDFSENVPSLFLKQAESQPNQIAIECEDESLTYLELNRRATQLALHLKSHGAGPEILVGLSTERGIPMLIGLLGILKSGAAYVPLDPSYPKDRINAMIESSGLKLLVTESSCLNALPENDCTHILIDQDWPVIEQATGALPSVLMPDTLAYVIYTSGSTGKPKGVQISHRALTNFLLTMQERPGLTNQDVLFAVTTISFDIAGLELYLPLIAGAKIILAKRETAMDGFALVAAIQKSKATVMQATPATWRMLMMTNPNSLGVQRVFCGGEALDGELTSLLHDMGAEIWNLYGPTETTIWSTACHVNDDNNETNISRKSAASIGYPIGNTQVYVLDEYLEPTPIGVPGELYIGGLGVSRGYFNQSGLTADRFIPDPFDQKGGARLYRTGDRCYFNSKGQLIYSGRIDFQVKVRGFRIELGEIESTLLEHDAVQNAVAVVKTDQASQAQLVAYVQIDPDWKESKDEFDTNDQQLDKWQIVWDETYKSNANLNEDDLSGWLSTYSGQPIEKAEMLRWTDETVHRIQNLSPSNILEIGCGTGLLLTRLAPHVAHYTGVDFSASVLGKLNSRIQLMGIQNVKLECKQANEFSTDLYKQFDTIIINSVSQYFPNIEYFVDVITKAIESITDGGHLFLGDLRIQGMQKIQHLSVAHFQHPDETSSESLRKLTENSIQQEEELVVDLALFAVLQSRLKRIQRVESIIKYNSDNNEMCKFRTDVVIHVGPSQSEAKFKPEKSLDYTGVAFDDNQLKGLLSEGAESVLIRNLPNTRLKEDSALFDQVFQNQNEIETESLITSTQTSEGISSSSLIEIGSANGYQTLIAFSSTRPEHCIDVIFTKSTKDIEFGVPIEISYPDYNFSGKNFNQFANQPDRNISNRILLGALRKRLQDNLPAYMVPTAIMRVDQMPMTPNGKIDRKALPTPDSFERQEVYVAPQTSEELTLTEIWSLLLGISKIGVHDNFFTLGGHSLLAVQVISKIRDAFSVELQIQTLFDSPTISELALAIQTKAEQAQQTTSPITPREKSERLTTPLSFAQQRLWFLSQLEGLASTYLISGAVRINGNLNIEILEKVFNKIIQRHESLRTRFVEMNGSPLAETRTSVSFHINQISIENVDSSLQDQEEQKIIQQETNRPFDLANDVLFRVTTIRKSSNLHTMVMSLHHIISDEWSMALLQQEIADLYRAFIQNQHSPLAELPIQYGDFAYWQRKWLSKEQIEQQLDYWADHLAQAPAFLELPTDFVRPDVSRHVGRTHSFTIDRSTANRIQRLAQSTGSTLFMTMLSGWAALLCRHANVADIVIGSPMTNRNRSELEPLIGFFVNTIPLRLNFAGNPTTRTILEQARQVALGAYANQDVPFDYIVERIKPERSLSHTPIFQTMFVMQNAPTAELALNDLVFEAVKTETFVSKFDLTLSVEQIDQNLCCTIEYSSELFKHASIENLSAEYAHLLKEMTVQIESPMASLPLISRSAWEQQQVNLYQPATEWLEHWSTGSALDLFAFTVKSHPDKIALSHQGRDLSYSALDELSNKLAHSLKTHGVKTNTVIGLHAEPDLNMIIGMLGILKAGACYLPLLPGTPDERIRLMLGETNAKFVLNSSLDLKLSEPGCDQYLIDDFINASSNSSKITWPIEPSSLAYIIYTSGSTGQPKGVMVSHHNLACSTQARLRYYKSEFSSLILLQPFSFDVATGNIFWTLCAGATLHLEPRSLAQDPQLLLKRIQETSSSHLVLLPLLYGPLLDLADHQSLSSLRNVIVGGEKMPRDLLQKHIEKCSQAALHNEYGPTEATVMCCAFQAHQISERANAVPIGKPIAPSTIYILDTYLNPVPAGMPGELCIGGPQVSLGYLSHPSLSADKFIPDPFSTKPGNRLYRSGDIARMLPDGNIEFVGRADQQVKIRGFRVELGEIQAKIKSHPSINDCVVLALDFGSSKRLVAYVILNADSELLEESLLQHLRGELPEYMLPSAFIELAEFPLTSNGKLDQRALPAPQQAIPEQAHIAPTNPIEQALMEIWLAVLGLKQIGVEDNFFTLGGDSILSIQIVSRANQAGINLTVKQLFQHQTIRKLASCVTIGQSIAIDQQPYLGTFDLSPIQRWYLDSQPAHPNHFNQSLFLEINQSITDQQLKQSIQALVHHHDMLRARFTRTLDREWKAHVSDAMNEDALTSIEFNTSSLQDQSERIREVANQAQQSLNIAEGPIWRVIRFKIPGASSDKLLWIIHHLVVDGISWRVLLEDLESCLRQVCGDQPIALPFKTTSFPHWSKNLHAYAADAGNASVLNYWLENTSTYTAALKRDFEATGSVQNDLSTLQTITTILPSDLSQALLTDGLKVFRAQINDLLLTALANTFEQWTGQSKLLITLEGHGREDLFKDVDISRTVGWFTSGFPVVLDMSSVPYAGDSQTGQRINQIKNILRSIPDHGVGFGIFRRLHPSAEIRNQLSRGDMPEVSFNYLGQFSEPPANKFILGEAAESSGREHALTGERFALIEVNGIFRSGALEFSWGYSNQIHRAETIEYLAQLFISELTKLSHLSLNSTDSYRHYAAMDFPLARIDQNALDEIVNATPQKIEDIYPLSPMQQGMLFHSELQEHDGNYIIQFTCTLRGDLNSDQFTQAWQTVVDRHPSLRAKIFTLPGCDPLQVVVNHAELPWVLHDWRNQTRDQQATQWSQLVSDDRLMGFNPQSAPMMRCALAQTGEHEWKFLWSHHHLLTDGWCLPILLNDAISVYESALAGKTFTQNSPRPYRDYIEWLSTRSLEEARQFWRHNLRDFDTPTSIGAIPSSTNQNEPAYHDESIELDEVLSNQLRQLSKQHSLTLSLIIQGAWSIVLSRYSGMNDVVFGATVSGRPPEIADVDGMIGLFINTLPVRVGIHPNQTLIEFFKNIREDQLTRDEFAYTPLVEIHSCTDVPVRQPLFESIVIFENYPVDEMLDQKVANLQFDDVKVMEQTSFPFTLTASPGKRIPIKLTCETSKMDANQSRRLLQHFTNLLESISIHIDGTVESWRHSMIPPVEYATLIQNGNETQTHTAHHELAFPYLFEMQVRAHPDRVAVSFENQAVTYAELNSLANQVANQLQSLNIGSGQSVAIYLNRSADMLAALIGVQKTGAAYIPLDPSYPLDRITYMIEDSGADIILADEETIKDIPSDQATVLNLSQILRSNQSTLWEQNASIDLDALAYVIYTSGSTGKPKGVELSHRGLTSFLLSMAHTPGLLNTDTLLAVTTISFDIAALELYLPLLVGAHVVIASRETAVDSSKLIDEIHARKITALQATPTTWRMLIEAGWDGESTLKRGFCGGEGFPHDLAQSMLTRGLDVWNLYGPTETTIWSSAYQIPFNQHFKPYEDIGRSIDNTSMYVVDQNMDLCPDGIAGELLIGGIGLAVGYRGLPAMTAEKFIPDPFSTTPGARLYKTGDRAIRLSNGILTCLGRIDHQIKVRGFRIEPGEIEVIISQHPAVKQTVITVWEPAAGDKRIAAYISRFDDSIQIDTIRDWARQQLPAHMVPTEWVFVEQFPLTPNGKLDRKALPDPSGAQQNDYVPPAGPTEMTLSKLMAEVLNTDRIGRDHDFFDLGGHSLLAGRLVTKIAQSMEIRLPLATLFDRPTVKLLAEYIETQRWAAQQQSDLDSDLSDDEEEFKL